VRVTQDVRRRTRARLLAEAERLVHERGFESVTTRDVAARAGIGHGTLFNYFGSREALGLALCDVFLSRAAADAERRADPDATLAEDLFAHGAACLRRLKPLRPAAGALFAGLLAVPDDDAEEADATPGQPSRVRARLFDAARSIVARRRPGTPPSPTALRFYVSLFVGDVCSWSFDASPHQEDTLALLDRATRLFAASLEDDGDPEKE
jgi:AcrR family transcriptional regulator